MIQLKKYQEEAVAELTRKARALLYAGKSRNRLVFKAPTGAGKTVMASAMLERLWQELAEENERLAVVWIAPNRLHEQSYLRMKSFFRESHVLRPVVFDEVDHSVGGGLREGEVLFVNWESINKERNLMVRETEQGASLFDLVRRTRMGGAELMVVVDEEHMFGGRQARRSEEVLRRLDPQVELRISATPISMPDAMVAVERSRVVEEQMVKEGITINPMVQDPGNGLSANEYLLDQAVAKLDEIKLAYEQLGADINPLLLIQLPNDGSETMDEEERGLRDMVVRRLDAVHGMTTANQRLAVWLSGEKSPWLDELHNPRQMTRALLFKQAIALGWDCPRAAVLLIFRNIRSEAFGIQTVGRIMRMPEQRFYPSALLNHGYVYTNLSRDRIQIVAEDMNYITRALVSTRREGIRNVRLRSVYSERLSSERRRIGPDFQQVLWETVNQRWLHHGLQTSLLSPFDPVEESGMVDTALNRGKAEAISGIDFTRHDIKADIVTDVEIEPEAGIYAVEQKHRRKYKNNEEQVRKMFLDFCAELVSGYEKQAALSLRGYIVDLMEEHFGVDEFDLPHIVLYNQNREAFRSLFKKAVERYDERIAQRQRAARSRMYKEYEWEVPLTREYNETANHTVPEVAQHALLPYVRRNNASGPETRFEAYLEAHRDKVEWWYKNGDEGKQHYAIAYTCAEGSEELFYVDYIIRTTDGQLYLFDTKTPGSDQEAPAKHNALRDYLDQCRDATLHGGVLIDKDEDNTWRYCPFKIENTSDFKGWSVFSL